jgi:protein-disulfide isomerase
MNVTAQNSSQRGRWAQKALRPFRLATATLAAVVIAATSVQAQMSDTEFEERVRSYILANPEIILEALDILSKREIQPAMAAKISEYPDLFTETPYLGIGPEDAPLRVVEFFDYRCAPCKTLHPKLSAALQLHPNIRVEMLQLPILSPGSERGARFALAVKAVAGAAMYRAVHADLWALKGPLRTAAFQQIAQTHGLDWTSVQREMNSDAVSERIARNRNIAIDLEILGTPAFVTPTSVSFGQSDAALLVESWLSQ